MPRTIIKKILEPFADAVFSGEKTFEIRKNDEGYQKGDIIRFNVMSSEYFTHPTHPLNDKRYEITYVLSGLGLQDGYVVFGIKPYRDEGDREGEPMIQIDMHMPKNCIECPIHDGEYGWCDLDADIVMNCDDRPDNCPLHEVKVITRGNCMMCGKELTEGLFFCKECEAKTVQGKRG